MRKPDEVFLFEQEIREKKQDRRNFMKKTGARGRGGKMYLPSDLMSRADRKKHTKAGEIIVTNIYDTILKKVEFEALEPHEQRNHLQYWRTKYQTKEIQRGMGVAGATYYKYIEDLGLPKIRGYKKRTGKTQDKKKEAPKQISASLPDQEEQQAPQEVIIQDKQPEPQQPAILVLNGLNIAYNGIYNSSEIQRMFSKLDLLLDGEDSEFEIELNIKERKKDKKK